MAGQFLPGGTITSPPGFLAGAVWAGISSRPRYNLDLGLLFSEAPCHAVGLFTQNKFKAAPVLISMERLPSGNVRTIVVNSGCANAGTGKDGLSDALKVTEAVSKNLGILPEEVLVASTGIIGRRLPVDLLVSGLDNLTLSRDRGHELARAMMTTDTIPKDVAVRASGYTIGGVAKGSGMIHPNLGTMLCFLTTDADIEVNLAPRALKEAVDCSFNMVTVDGDTSSNDMVILLANGLSGKKINLSNFEDFRDNLTKVCTYLARAIARDGEGATRLLSVVVMGAASHQQAKLASKAIASSYLVKAAIHGGDPNWGRILVALGKSDAIFSIDKLNLSLGGIPVFRKGAPLSFDPDVLTMALRSSEVMIEIDLGLGDGQAKGWGCDLSEEYVTINSEYTT
jgi:glutamate N-acetyltransferase/amino-acid N-acetyltransferase